MKYLPCVDNDNDSINIKTAYRHSYIKEKTDTYISMKQTFFHVGS